MTNDPKKDAIDTANARLASAGLPTYSELLALLVRSQRLGLSFDIGRAYISRAYIDEQTALNGEIFVARNAQPGV